ncbi:MAG: XTP/dITP diphosphatase [Deltaproteobacteria bacterium]|nr:MAG: XTP/dITP diphosphatase [Deltaproteobacteria bacterium]
MEEIVIATKNSGKIREFYSLLYPIFSRIISLGELGCSVEIVEDGSSFSENALKKARIVAELTKKPTIADDSGLEVFALNGRPGIFSARYAGENAGDRENIEKLLRELKGITDRRARFVCSLALVFPDGEEVVAEGVCEGTIVDKPRGNGGFGYDPVFLLPEVDKTMAELSLEEKNLFSHRARALRALIMYLNGRKKARL